MNTKELSTYLARVVLQVPDQHPKTHKAYTQEVLFTLRPGWSNSGAYQRSLPGGKLETQDFNGVVQSSNELFELPTSTQLDALIAIGFYTAVRELSEELGLVIAPSLLHFVDWSRTKTGWTTLGYAMNLDEKPTLVVKPESAGTVWLNSETIKNGKPKMLPGHLKLAKKALAYLQK